MLNSLSDRRYRLVSKIDAGGFGEVWEAVEPASGEKWAIKLHYDPVIGLRETTVLFAVSHPGVIELIDLGYADRKLFTVMTWYPTTLHEAIDRKLTLPPSVYDQLIEAVEELHRFGWSHGDLAAYNVLVGQTPVLADFGSAVQRRFCARPLQRPRTEFAPREPIESLSPIEIDSWGLGSLIYASVFHRPFPGRWNVDESNWLCPRHRRQLSSWLDPVRLKRGRITARDSPLPPIRWLTRTLNRPRRLSVALEMNLIYLLCDYPALEPEIDALESVLAAIFTGIGRSAPREIETVVQITGGDLDRSQSWLLRLSDPDVETALTLLDYGIGGALNDREIYTLVSNLSAGRRVDLTRCRGWLYRLDYTATPELSKIVERMIRQKD